MYDYININPYISIVLILMTYVLIFWKKAPQRTMEHMVGRLATKFIETMLEQVRQKIITQGYEHWTFDVYQKEFTLPELCRCSITVKNILFTGASKFVTNNVKYDVTTSRAIFDISIPKLYLGVSDANVNATINVIGMNIETQLKGWVTLLEPRVSGAVVLEVDDEGKVTASSIEVEIHLKDIQSKINLSAMETDYSEIVNNFLQAKLPELINTYVNSYKGAIEVGLKSIANPILAQMF